MTTRSYFRLPMPVAAASLMALLLAGCESSTRMADVDYGARPVLRDDTGPGIAAPTSRVTAAPLAPISAEPLAPVATSPSAAPAVAATPAPSSGQVAALSQPSAPVTPRARGLAGSWKISDAARGACAINLTQTPLLDLYRASPAGCQAGSLAKVDAWQQRGQEVVLLEPGGRTAVRLFPKGDGTYEGSATTSGAVIRMSR